VTRRERLTFWGILALGTAVRLAFLRVHQVIERDGAVYASVAEHLARSGRLIDLREQYHTFYPPGYPLLVAPVYSLVGDSHRAGQIVSLACGIVLIAIVYALGRRLGGVTVGLVGAALVALYLPLAHEAVSVHTESLFAALLCLLVLSGLRLLDRPGAGGAAVAGGLVGTMYLVRPEGLLLGIVGMWIGGVWLSRAQPLARVAGRLVAFLLALFLVAAPYVAYLHSVTGAWLLTGKGILYSVAESPAEAEAIYFGPPRALPWRGVRAEAAVFAERCLRNFFAQEGKIAENLSLLAVGLAAIGLAAGKWREHGAAEGLLLCGLVPLFFYPAFEVVSRWTEPYLALAAILIAGIDRVASRMQSPRGRRRDRNDRAPGYPLRAPARDPASLRSELRADRAA
jgi:4-amino-4-deoxy-L-arabinose transferase-like glycosyltransferase